MPATTKTDKPVVLNGITGLEPVTPAEFNKAVADGLGLRAQLMKELDQIPASAWVNKVEIPKEARASLTAKQKLIMRRFGSALAFLKAMNASA